MSQNLTQVRRPSTFNRRHTGRTTPQTTQHRPEAERLLRDIAFVLQATRTVKAAILADAARN